MPGNKFDSILLLRGVSVIESYILTTVVLNAHRFVLRPHCKPMEGQDHITESKFPAGHQAVSWYSVATWLIIGLRNNLPCFHRSWYYLHVMSNTCLFYQTSLLLQVSY